MFIDCHCHLDIYSDIEIENIIKKCRKKGIGLIINNGVNSITNRKSLELSKKFKEIKCALGVYPIDALSMTNEEIDDEIRFIEKNDKKIIAIGEVGVDFKETEDKIKQIDIFKKFIKLSKKIKKPLIIHSRKAEKEVVDLLEEEKAEKVLMHCFSGNMKLVERIVKNGWSLSIPAIVKHSEHFQNIVKIVPISNLLCETDSPFLHPEKKTNNTPENIIESYKKIAEIKGISLEECEKFIEENFKRLFN